MLNNSTSAFIELTSVSKQYNNRTVLDDVSLIFSEPGFYSIVGSSGAGKTTLLSLMCGFEKPTSGTIKKKGKIGFVFQESNLLADFSVLDNIKIVGTDEMKALDILSRFGLSELANTKVNLLSGGEKQRVAVVRCLGMDSDVLILDEPTGNLDKENAVKLFDQLKEISKEKIVIVVTHDRELAESYSDTVLNIKDGKVVTDKPMTGKSTDSDTQPEEAEASSVLSKYRFKYAFNLIKGKIGFFIASVLLFTLTLTLEFFCLSFSMYDKIGTLYEASKSLGLPYYTVSQNLTNEPTEKRVYLSKGSFLENEIIEAVDESPLLVKSGLSAKEKAIAPTYSFSCGMYSSEWKFDNVEGSMPSSDDEILITDFAGKYLFGDDVIIGKTVTFPHFFSGESGAVFKISGYIKTAFSDESFRSFFFDSSFQDGHKFEYDAKYMTVYWQKESLSKALYDIGALSLAASNFAEADTASVYTSGLAFEHVRASSVEGLPTLVGSNIIVSQNFVDRYFAESPVGHSFAYPDIYQALNRTLYLEKMNMHDLYPEVTIAGVSDQIKDFAVSDEFFEKICQAYIPFFCNEMGVRISSKSQVEAIDRQGLSFANSAIMGVYGITDLISDFAPSLYVVDGIILAIVMLASFLVFSSLINRKMHEFAVLRCLGANNGKITSIFLAYLTVSFSICFVLSVVAGSILQVVLESFLKSLYFGNALGYTLFLWNPLACLGLLVTCLFVGALIAIFPLIKITKIDSGLLLKKSV